MMFFTLFFLKKRIKTFVQYVKKKCTGSIYKTYKHSKLTVMATESYNTILSNFKNFKNNQNIEGFLLFFFMLLIMVGS